MEIRNEEQLVAAHVREQIIGIEEALVAFPPVSSTATAAASAVNRTSAPAPVVVAASPAIVIAPVPPISLCDTKTDNACPVQSTYLGGDLRLSSRPSLVGLPIYMPGVGV